MNSVNLERLYRRKDLIDMMTSMHSKLSSTYQKLSLILDVMLIFLSIVLLTFVFVDQSFLSSLGIEENETKITLGLSSIFMSFFSLMSYIIDWRGKKICHDQAFKTLIGLRDEWRIFLLNPENINCDKILKLEEKTCLILSQCINIDDRVFNKLKRKHYVKVELSKAISKNPYLPLFLHRLRLLKAAFVKCKDGNSERYK